MVLFTVSAWDANCPQHIPERFDAAEVAEALAQRDQRIKALEAELGRLLRSAMPASARRTCRLSLKPHPHLGFAGALDIEFDSDYIQPHGSTTEWFHIDDERMDKSDDEAHDRDT